MRRKIEAIRRRFGPLSRVLALLLVLFLFSGALFSMVTSLDVVTVTDEDGGSVTLVTTSRRPAEIVRMAGFSTGQNDSLVYTPAAGEGPAEILIRRAFPVTLHAGGQSFTEEVLEGTVDDLLAGMGVELEGEDYFEPAGDTPLYEGLIVQVYRVSYTREIRREEPGAEAVGAYKATLPEGHGFIESFNGAYDVTYEDKLVDGKVVASEVVEMIPLITPRPVDSYTITPGVPCSRIMGFDDIEMGADGLPVNYTSMWQGAVCTAYSASRGRGSSGLGLYCGTVAVNPNRIPYGSRMYVTSADGGFVYGFAIATDTGTAMMEGYVDLDLFFETNAECLQFGKRALNVYFLD